MLLVNSVLCKTVCLIFGIDILNNESAILKTACLRGHEIYACVVSAPLRRMFPCPRRHRGSISQFFSQGKEQSRKKLCCVYITRENQQQGNIRHG